MKLFMYAHLGGENPSLSTNVSIQRERKSVKKHSLTEGSWKIKK